MSQNSKKEEARASVQNTESPINKSSNDDKEVQESGTNETQKPTQAKVKHPQRRKVVGHYYIEEEIGEGTFGKVRKGQHKLTKESVAIKILEKNRISDVTDVERVAREIHILKLIRHPNIVQLYEIIETPGQLYLIMEFASGGELFDYIVKKTRIPEQEACKFFQQIMAGVEYIHSLNIVHRDLKPENLLLDHHNNIKIVDFGLSNTFSQNEYLKTACGSPCYAAPEMIAGLKYQGDKVDLWSCGVILYALVCGFLPFEDPDTTKLYKKILKGRYIIPGFISANVVDLIGNILTQDPEQRPGIGKIREHPWFKLSSPVCMNKGIIVGYSQIHHDPKALLELDKLSLQTNVKMASSEQISFNREHTIRCLDANKHNHETTCYYLMLAKLQKNGTVSPLSQYKHVISQITSPHENTLKSKLVASPDDQANSNNQEQQQRDVSLGKKNATVGGVAGSKKRHSSVQRSTTTSNKRQLQLNNMNKLRQLDRKDYQQNQRTAKEQVSLDLCSPVAAKMAHQGGSSTDRKNSAKPAAQNVYTKKKLANDLLRFEQQRMNQDVVNQEYADGKAGREVRQSGPKQLHKSLIDSDDTFGSLILETEKSNVPKISTLNPVPENHQVNVTKSANSMMSGNQVSSKNRDTVKVKNAVRGGIQPNSKGQSPRTAFAATGEENVSHIQPSYVSSPRNIASVFYPQTNHVQSQMNSMGGGAPIQNQIHFDDNSFIQDIVNRSTSLDTQQKTSQMVVRHRNIANQQAVSSAQHQQHQLSQQFNTLRHPPAAGPHGIKHQVFQTKQNSQDMSYPMVTNTTSSLRPQHNSFSQDQHQHMLTQGNNYIKVGSHKRQPKQSLVNKRRTNHGAQQQYQQALLAGTTSSALSVTAGGAQVVNASSAVGTYRRPSNMRASTLGPASDGQHQHHAVMQNAQQHSNNNNLNSGSSQNRLQYSSRSSSKKGGRATSSSRKKMIDQGKIIQLNLSAIGKESSGITASLGGGHHSSSTDKKTQKAIGTNHVSGGAGGRIKRINNGGGGGNTLITNSSNVLSGQVALDCTGDQNNESAMHNSMVQHWHSSNLINVDTTTFGGIDSVNTTGLINNSSLALAGLPANNQYNTATSANVSLSTIPAKTLPSEPTTRALPSRNSVLRINNHQQSNSQQQYKNEAVQGNQAAQVSVRTLAKNRLPPTKKQQLIQNLQETIEEQKRRQDHQTSTAAVAQNTSGNLATSAVPTHNIQLKLIQQFQKAVNQVPQQHQSNPYSRPSRGGAHATSKQSQASANNNNQQQQRRKSSQQSANRAKEIASVSASGTSINLTSGRVVGGGAVLKNSNQNKLQQQSSESNSVNQTMVYPQKWHKKHQQQLSGLAMVEDNNKELFQSYQHGGNTNYNLNDSGVNLSYATMVNNTLINQNQNKSIASQNMQILNQSAATISPDYHSMTNLRITASSAASDNDNSPDQRAPQKNYQSSTVINSIKANKKGAPQRAGHHHRHSLGSGVLAISNAQGASSITRPQRASEQQNSKQSYKPGRKLTTAASSQNNTSQQAIAFRRNSAQQHQQQQQSNKQNHTRVNSQASQRSSKQNYSNQQQQQLAYQGSSARGSDLNHKQQQYVPMTSQQQYTDNGGQVSNETINTAGGGMQHGRRKIHIARTTRNHHLVQQSQNQTSRQRVSNSNRNSITNPVQLTGQTNQTKKPPIKHSQQLKQASRRVAPLNMISTSSAYLESGNNSMNLLNHHPNSVSGYVRISSKTRGDIFADEPRIGVVAPSDSPSAGQQQQHNASFQAIMHGGGIQSPLNIVQQDSAGLHNQSMSLPQQHQSQLNQMQQKQRLGKKTALGQSRLYASQQKNRKEQPSGMSAVGDSSNVSLHVNEQTNNSSQWMQQYGAAGAPANGRGNSSSQQFSAQANQQAQDQAASSHYVVIPAWHMDNSVHKQ